MRREVILLLIVLLIGIAVGYLIPRAPPQIVTERVVERPEVYTVEYVIPALDRDGNGVIIDLKVEAQEGSGQVLTNIEDLLFWVDTQYSIQVARGVAENITGIDLSKTDLTYTIETGQNASILGGQSAGAALTLATIAALENTTLDKSIMITGTIDQNGTIGEVGGVAQKAEAAQTAGAQLFLVPPGQGTQTTLEPHKECRQLDGAIYCEITYEEISKSVLEGVDIQVQEVSNIDEALEYFDLK